MHLTSFSVFVKPSILYYSQLLWVFLVASNNCFAQQKVFKDVASARSYLVESELETSFPKQNIDSCITFFKVYENDVDSLYKKEYITYQVISRGNWYFGYPKNLNIVQRFFLYLEESPTKSQYYTFDRGIIHGDSIVTLKFIKYEGQKEFGRSFNYLMIFTKKL